ncbi:MAG: outer membrane lipid asymmetry maintenance protein MlaD [Gammaproteobacteria bacterium]|jgi:phospholipid/cholesterol/gamma-HCH transport system substrate-binding protein|nr:outer membrane lipid asymmetry maintenance protein MlaD [Gammaproteobacteria bacterium]
MERIKAIEIGVGLFVTAGLAALFMLAMQVSNLSSMSNDQGYEIIARFENVGGLKVRSPVSVGGVRVGRVSSIEFDMETFEAVVRLQIVQQYDKFPKDTSARIFTAGLLGEQYVALEPGGAEESLAAGDEIRLTQSALVLEQIIGQFLFSKAAEGAKQ